VISAYCLGYQHWTVIPDQMRSDFAEMASMGVGAVCLTFSESEMRYSRRAFEWQVRLAHEAGLEVYVIPSRLGGRFAGAPLAPSVFLAEHPECLAPVKSWMPVVAVESPVFREWIKGFLKTLLTDYPLDGIIWDEPKEVGTIHRHPDAVRLYGKDPSEAQMIGGFLDFLGDLTAHCQALRPSIKQTLFCQKTDPESFTRKAAALPHLVWHGYDGNFCRQSFFHEEPRWHKYRLDTVWDRTVSECQGGGKKTFALVENMIMPMGETETFEKNFGAYLETHHPDHLSVYYYAHNNEDPVGVHEAVKRVLKRYRG
jgi:hypothetical protein